MTEAHSSCLYPTNKSWNAKIRQLRFPQTPWCFFFHEENNAWSILRGQPHQPTARRNFPICSVWRVLQPTKAARYYSFHSEKQHGTPVHFRGNKTLTISSQSRSLAANMKLFFTLEIRSRRNEGSKSEYYMLFTPSLQLSFFCSENVDFIFNVYIIGLLAKRLFSLASIRQFVIPLPRTYVTVARDCWP